MSTVSKRANPGEILAVIAVARMLPGTGRLRQEPHVKEVLDAIFAWALKATLTAMKHSHKGNIDPLVLEGMCGDNSASTIAKKFLKNVRMVINTACQTMKTDECLHPTASSDGELVFQWYKWDSSELQRELQPCLKYFTHYRENTFVDQLLLGMAYGAKEYGLDLHVHRVDSDHEILACADADKKAGLEPTYLVDWSTKRSTEVLEEQLREKGITVVSTANFGSAIYQANQNIGKLAAEYLLKHGLQEGDEVLVTRPVSVDGTPLSEYTPTEQRWKAFFELITQQGAKVVTLPVPDMRMGGVMSVTAELLREYINSNHPRAIFATSGDAGLAATLTIPEWKSIPIVSADMTCELIQLLLERSNCLQALVGVSPYFYGRLKMQRIMQNETAARPVKPYVLDRFTLAQEFRHAKSMFELVTSGYFEGIQQGLGSVSDAVSPVVVAILGGSASGKTTLAKFIKRLSSLNEVTVIPIDAFYLDYIRHLERKDFEVRESFDWVKLVDVVDRLLEGEMARVPTYHIGTSSRSVSVAAYPAPIIVLEGLHALDDAILSRVNVKIFVDLPDDIRYQRRLDRDLRDPDRKQTKQEIEIKWNRAQEVYEQFIRPRSLLDGVIVVDGTKDFNEIAKDILQRARALSQKAT